LAVKVIASTGRIARPQAIDARVQSGLGSGLVQLGASITRASENLDRGLRTADLNGASVAASEGLAGLEEKFLQNTNPADIQANFTKELTAFENQVLEGITDGRDRSSFKAQLSRRTVGTARRVNGHRLSLLADQAVGDLNTLLEQGVSAAATAATPADRAVIVDGMQDSIKDNVTAGWITSARGVALAAGLNNRLSKIDALTMIEKDPAAALKALGDSNRFKGLAPEERLRFRDAARVDIARLDRAVAAQAREHAAGARSSLSEIDRILATGLVPSDDVVTAAKTSTIASGDAALATRFNETLRLAEAQRGFTVLTPSELQAEVSVLAAGKGDGLAAKKLTLARSLLGTMTSELARDPLSWASRAGGFALAPLDPSAPVTEDLALARIATAENIAGFYNTPVRYLTDEERSAFTAFLDGSPPDTQLAFLASLNGSFGGSSQKVMAEISKEDGLYAHVGGLANLGGVGSAQATTARRILTGAKALKDNRDLGIDPALRAEAVTDTVGNAFGTQSSLRANVLAAADAIFADMQLRGRVDVGDEIDAYSNAINFALGGDGERGGIGDINGQQTVLPSAMSAGQVDDFLTAAKDSDLALASEGGGVPTHSNGTAFTADELRAATLVAVGDGRYLVDRDGAGDALILGSGLNGFYVLDMRKLSELTAERVAQSKKVDIEKLSKLRGINR